MRSSIAAAVVMSAGLALWLASRPLEELLGLGPPPPAAGVAGAPPAATAPRATVRVTESVAQPVAPEIVLNGTSEPVRAVVLRAEIAGRVVATPVAQGTEVEAGRPLVELDPRDRPARIRELEARLAQRELEYEAARRLGAKQFQAETRVAEALAELELARARLAEARLELERATIRAPFAGRLERRRVELGDFLEIGQEVALLVEQRPFLVVGQAPETVVGRLAPGLEGSARLADGRVLEGRLRFVAARADGATRTFRVELEIADPPADLPAGMTARLAIRLPPVPAHRLPAGALVLDDRGRIGVRHVEADERVRFAPSEIVRAEAGWLWLVGPPARARVITTGQGFVGEGETVSVRPEPADASDGPAA